MDAYVREYMRGSRGYIRAVRVSRLFKVSALVLALLIGVPYIGLVLDAHYCKGELKSIALFGKAKSCHELDLHPEKQGCPYHSQGEQHEDDCCHNEHHFIKSNTPIITSNTAIAHHFIPEKIHSFPIPYLGIFSGKCSTIAEKERRSLRALTGIELFGVDRSAFLCRFLL